MSIKERSNLPCLRLPASSIMNRKVSELNAQIKYIEGLMCQLRLNGEMHGDRKQRWKLNYHLQIEIAIVAKIKHKFMHRSYIAINSAQAGNVSMERFTLTAAN